MNVSPILEKMEKLEKDLQELKVRLFVDLSEGKDDVKGVYGVYKDEDILSEIKKIRKRFWNERYAKTVKGIS